VDTGAIWRILNAGGPVAIITITLAAPHRHILIVFVSCTAFSESSEHWIQRRLSHIRRSLAIRRPLSFSQRPTTSSRSCTYHHRRCHRQKYVHRRSKLHSLRRPRDGCGMWWACLSVCLSVWLSAVRSQNSKTAWLNFTKFFMHVACGRGSVRLWRRCDMLCTSGFTN